MLVKNYTDVPAETVAEGAVGTTIRWLVAKDDGAPNFAMRLLEIQPGGNTPNHTHDWEHEVFILEGEGELVGKNERLPLKPGVCGLVPGGENHYFENTGADVMKMLCLVPIML